MANTNEMHVLEFPPYIELYIYMYKDALRSTLRNYRNLKKLYYEGIDAIIITSVSKYEQFYTYEKEFTQDLLFLLNVDNNNVFNIDINDVIIRYFSQYGVDFNDIKRLAKRILLCPIIEFYRSDTAKVIRERKKK